MADSLWFIVVALCPLFLGVAIAYAILRHRRLTRREQPTQTEANRDLYYERR